MELYPKTYYVTIENLKPYYQGRITISKLGSFYNAEIDLVQTETGKIFEHVADLYQLEDEREALDSSMYKLQNYLRSSKSSQSF